MHPQSARDWRRAQQRRLGAARECWIQTLAEAGWNILGAGSRSLAYLRPDLLEEYDSGHEENLSATGESWFWITFGARATEGHPAIMNGRG
jgi:hypothetical protein